MEEERTGLVEGNQNQEVELAAEDGTATCVHFFKLLFELIGRQPVLVQTVVPVDPVQNLQVSANQPVATFHHHLETRQINHHN